MNGVSNNFTTGDLVAVVQESSFWVQGGNLKTSSAGVTQQIAGNVEDLQVAVINNDQSVIGDVSSAGFAGLTTAQLLNVRAVRLSVTAKTSRDAIRVVEAEVKSAMASGKLVKLGR